VPDELFDTLLRFHREVVQPELNEIRGEVRDMRGEMQDIRGEIRDIRGEMQVMRGDIDAIRDTMATRTELQAMRAEMVTWPVLMQFYNDVIKPDFDEVLSRFKSAVRSEMLSHVDGIYVKLNRLDTEYQALRAAFARVEKEVAAQNADRMEVRSELLGLKDQISKLNDRIAGRDTN
jgi:predicted  nucleic acid-binding Zn-ribbon protein